MKNKNIYFSYGGEDLNRISNYLEVEVYDKIPFSVLPREETCEDVVCVKRNGSFPEEEIRYILSKERRFLPNTVSCGDKSDYSRVEKIVSEEFGGHLETSFSGRIFNCREIEKPGETPRVITP